MRARVAALVRAATAALLTAAAGCATREEPWEAGPPPDPNGIVILDAGQVALQADADAILRAAFPEARRLRVEQLVTAGPRLRQEGAVLIAPDLAALTPAHWAQLTNHIRRGGPTLFWGLDPAGGEPGGRLAMLRPFSEYYTFPAREIRGADGGMIQTVQPMRFQSSFPRGTGTDWRWIPLAEAREPAGHARGWPAALMFEAPSNGPLRAWGWIGWAPDAAFASAQRALLRRAARRLGARQILISADIGRATLAQSEPIEARMEMVSTTSSHARIVIEMENTAGVITRRFTEKMEPPRSRDPISRVSTSVVLGAAPRAIAHAEDIRFRFMLSDAAGDRQLDERIQRVRLLPDADEPMTSSDERLGVRGASFIIGRRPLTLFGAVFDPLIAHPPGAALDATRYDPALAIRELDLYREAAFNLVEVAYASRQQAPQLRHLLDAMRERQLWAIVSMPQLSPWSPRWEEAGESLSALRLSRSHRIFAVAVDLAPPPDDPDAQARLRAAWNAWIDEQYGDSDHAARAWGVDPRALVPGLDAARDPNLSDEARRAVARFFHDHLSRHLRECRRVLHAHADGALLTAFGGEAYPAPPDVHHPDFLTRTIPDASAAREPGRLEFMTAFARGFSGGRAVLWRHGGVPLAYPPDAENSRHAAELIRDTGRALARARAAGLLYAAIGGGPRPPAGLDIGLVNPDMTWRPGGDAWRERINEWRRLASPTPVWRGRDADAWSEAAWARWGDRYAAEAEQGLIEEMRPLGWGRSTRDLPAVGLGNSEHVSPAPFEFVNAEWMLPATSPDGAPGRARLRQPVQLELLNTGAAAWSPSVTGQIGAVWVRARSEHGRSLLLPLRETAPGARASMVWTPTDPGVWTLRAWLHPAGEFGEALRFHVE